MKDKCLPCIINQAVKVAEMTGAEKKEKLYQAVFKKLGEMDLDKVTPEIIGETFEIIKQHIGCEDPYLELRNKYNKMFLEQLGSFEDKIAIAQDPFLETIKYAIIGNAIDFNPIHNSCIEEIMSYFEKINSMHLAIDHSSRLKEDIKKSRCLLYLGDNCGEICLDKLLIKKIKAMNPEIEIYFGVRGKPVVNDSVRADAYHVGIDDYAHIISNGDYSLGTVLNRTSQAFRDVYERADVVIAKGQANYECLSEENKCIYFLLLTKCKVIADDIGVAEKVLICKNNMIFRQE